MDLRIVDTLLVVCATLFFVASFSSMHPHPVFISESDIWSLPRFSMDFDRAQPSHFSSPPFPPRSFLLLLLSLRAPRIHAIGLSMQICQAFFSDFSLERSQKRQEKETKGGERFEKIKKMTAIKALIRSPCSGNTHLLERVVPNEYRDCQFRRFHVVLRRSM